MSEEMKLLYTLRAELSRVYHDVNNPLAIISGNAQFLLELARAVDLDEDFLQPIRDIEEASQQMADSLKAITRLRDQIPVQSTKGEGL